MKTSDRRCFQLAMATLFLMALYFLYQWNLLKQNIQVLEPIEYVVTDKYKSKGRSRTVTMDILYEGKDYTLDITSRDYHNLDKGIYPELFFLKERGCVFYRWTIKKSLRVALLSFIGSFAFAIGLIWSQYVKKT